MATRSYRYCLGWALVCTVLLCGGCFVDNTVPYEVPSTTDADFFPPANLRWQLPLSADTSLFSREVDPLLFQDRLIYARQSTSMEIAGDALYCVDLNGELQWIWNDHVASLRNNKISATVIVGEVLVVQVRDNYYGVNPGDGSTLWTNTRPRGKFDLVAVGDYVYQVFDYYAPGDTDGASIWRCRAATGDWERLVGELDVTPSCIVYYGMLATAPGVGGDDYLYYRSGACPNDTLDGFRRTHAYNLTTEQSAWTTTQGRAQTYLIGPPLVSDSLVVAVNNRSLEAFGRADGTPRWISPITGTFRHRSFDYVLAQGVIVSGDDPENAGFDAATGALLWTVRGEAFERFLTAGDYLIRSNPDLSACTAGTGRCSTPLLPYNVPPDAESAAPRFDYGIAVDPVRDRLYASDGYYLIALDLPL